MRVGIALGSNLGDRVAHLRSAVAAIRQFATTPVLVSRVYETEPVDCPQDSLPFLNAAMEIGYSDDLSTLLKRLQAIEEAAGRPALREINTPRPIDLDILYADELQLNQAELVVPHPRLMSRPFVLLPLNDIVPDRILPSLQITFSEGLNLLENSNHKITHVSID